MATEPQETSPLSAALQQVGDRWSLLVVDALLDGPRRFNDLQEAVGGIAPNILSRRLGDLERAGVVVPAPYSQRPPRFTYDLTAAGRELAGAVRLLAEWGSSYGGTEGLHHDACGTPVEARWYCPTCARSLDEGEATELSYV